MVEIKRGDIVLTNLNPVKGSEQRGIRPCLIIQNNEGNKYSPLTIIAPLTSKVFSKEFPTNVQVSSSESKLEKESTILLNQIRTIDKSRIIKKISNLLIHTLNKVDLAIKKSLDLR
jgi:mRNA interferase MazF